MSGGRTEGRRPDAAVRRARLVEAAAWVVALAAAVVVIAHIAGTARAALLFTDGDSMLPILVMRSIGVGQPQDWALSSVLFIPELLVFGAIWALHSAVDARADATIVVNGVLNLVALYGVLRVVAGRRGTTAAPVAGALAAFAAFCVLASLDHTSSRDSLELASLLATTTYYSATVIGVIASIGLARRVVDGSPRRRALLVGLTLVAAVSVLSNPLFLLWAVAPLVLVLAVSWLRRRDGVLLWIAAGLVGGSIAGGLGRIPLAPLIANDGLGYIDVSAAGASAAYYGQLVVGLCSTPAGAVSAVLTAALLLVAVGSSIRLRGSGTRGAFFVATAGWVVPVVVLVAAILLGTHASRYLQPVVFAPVTALAVIPDVLRMLRPGRTPHARRAWAAAAAAGGAVLLVAAGVYGIPRLVTAADPADPDLACVTSWVDASGRTGGGQYWTVRLPKAHVADPRTLVQVDDTLRPYDWLVNRTDADVGAVSFLVIDDQSPPFALPGGATMADATLVSCGRYTIADFGDTRLPLGAPRS